MYVLFDNPSTDSLLDVLVHILHILPFQECSLKLEFYPTESGVVQAAMLRITAWRIPLVSPNCAQTCFLIPLLQCSFDYVRLFMLPVPHWDMLIFQVIISSSIKWPSSFLPKLTLFRNATQYTPTLFSSHNMDSDSGLPSFCSSQLPSHMLHIQTIFLFFLALGKHPTRL